MVSVGGKEAKSRALYVQMDSRREHVRFNNRNP